MSTTKVWNTSEFVKAARAGLHMTQTELGEKLGLHRRTIWHYERGGELPLSVRLAILHLLGQKKAPRRLARPTEECARPSS